MPHSKKKALGICQPWLSWTNQFFRTMFIHGGKRTEYKYSAAQWHLAFDIIFFVPEVFKQFLDQAYITLHEQVFFWNHPVPSDFFDLSMSIHHSSHNCDFSFFVD